MNKPSYNYCPKCDKEMPTKISPWVFGIIFEVCKKCDTVVSELKKKKAEDE